MRTNPRSIRVAHQNVLVVLLVVFITLFGLSLKLQAQSPVLGNDFEKVSNSMKVQMNNLDFDVLIPKVNKSELSALTEANYTQLVYVTDENPGFYMFSHNQWKKQNVRNVLAVIELNMQMGEPSTSDMIIETTTEGNSKQLLDYNSHIHQLYNGFSFEEGSNQMTISIN
ncbi:hypothetical protein JKA74_03930 [Marivirga sp. S37H4]|uniref:Uncharacterized protein n=1 Tax=Marivirga aurantiaca TaxID=2802615 RepID=A0A935C654_9BACT|nr:hypothetical protein [Marivirga aurantiaca]MBK6264175.1 hypothetical protein [Marivirga aurantiaca]